ncbi:MAG: hypothetical protein JWO28_2200 [Hyphomicrobiales bacterium]|nr:hypothetical protein [Hyphomicrobiales bacterium]
MQPMPPNVDTAFQAFPPGVRHRLGDIRAMILGVASGDARIGAITETLKWGEPAYLTEATGSGSTIRLGWPRNSPDRAAIYFICRTNLVDTFRERFGGIFEYEANRAVLLPVTGDIDRAPLEILLSMALTYHLR